MKTYKVMVNGTHSFDVSLVEEPVLGLRIQDKEGFTYRIQNVKGNKLLVGIAAWNANGRILK